MSPQGAPDPECVMRPSQEFPRFCLSFPLLGNPNPPGRQGCMWPHYFTLALHGITDDWGECRRLESTAEGEFWCGEQTPPPGPPNCVFLSEKHTIYPVVSRFRLKDRSPIPDLRLEDKTDLRPVSPGSEGRGLILPSCAPCVHPRTLAPA